MFRLTGQLPKEIYLACSGGVDSMVALHFLRHGCRDVIPLYFNHGTEFGDKCEAFLKSLDMDVICGKITKEKEKGRSQEDFWRECRYEFLDQFDDRPVITMHHLADQLETLIQGVAHGVHRQIPYQRGNYIRPFLQVKKEQIIDYAKRNNLKYLDDPSNKENKYTRNRIRNNIIPELLKVNPGLYKSMSKLIN